MTVVKVVEIIAQSEKSWEDAARMAVQEASQTIRNIQNVYIENMQGIVDGGQITKYRVNAKVSFVVDGTNGQASSEPAG